LIAARRKATTGVLRVFQSGWTAQGIEHNPAPVQYLRGPGTAGPAQSGFEAASRPRPAAKRAPHQAGQDIGLALGEPVRRAGAAPAQFTDPGLDVAEIAQHDPRGLMATEAS